MEKQIKLDEKSAQEFVKLQPADVFFDIDVFITVFIIDAKVSLSDF